MSTRHTLHQRVHSAIHTCPTASSALSYPRRHALAAPSPLCPRHAGQYAKVFDAIIQKSREEAKAAGLKSISSDINHQDKAGKTPLYLAIEHNNLTLMKLLYTLGAESPDSLLVNNQGWTIMHSAVNTDNLETLKKLMDFFTPQRVKLLLQTPDKTGREPLHIAAYKCSEEMVTYLMDVGAANLRVDSNGNDPAKLADRAGRRKSKEIIERRSSKEEAASP